MAQVTAVTVTASLIVDTDTQAVDVDLDVQGLDGALDDRDTCDLALVVLENATERLSRVHHDGLRRHLLGHVSQPQQERS